MILAHVSFCLAERLETEDVVYLADDEQQAEAIAAIVAALRPDNPVILVPSSDALPGDTAPPSPANSGRRVAALRALRRAQTTRRRPRIALVLSGEAAARCYPPTEAFDSAPPCLKAGDAIDLGEFSVMGESLGYIVDDRVDEPGEMALRGEVIDIFPADAGMPARIDIADGRVGSIRRYDPITQRATDDLARLEIGRAAEPEIDEPVSILAHISAGVIAMSPKADARRKRFIELAADCAKRGGTAVDAIDDAHWSAAIGAWTATAFDDPVEPVPRFAEKRSPLAAFAKFVKPLLDDGRALIVGGLERDLRFLRNRIARRLSLDVTAIGSRVDGKTDVTLMELPIRAGFFDDRQVVVAAADILGSRAQLGEAPASPTAVWTAGMPDLRVGDIVIHEDHGVARVRGLEPTTANDTGGELIALEFAKGARRLVTIEDADRLWRYGADGDAVTLDTLSGTSWTKRRATIDAAIAESARGLAELAEVRATLKATVIDPDAAAYERFASRFPFSETADQARAIAAVRADLANGTPMDRLVVGDVGYGKTEVAMRAAALAALAGHQVIVAAPTTVLVRQHLETFRRRFDGTGITVAGLSRLSSAAERKAVKAGLADGSIGVVVGTGAVMAKGVHYAKLGLVVIDEEQRFGAADKARLRGSGETHLLTLSATPIPRTLQMALVGLQQVSLITTPPATRQPIRTSLDRYNDVRIRTALLREKGRGGQSFVVVPRIEDMADVAARLRRAAPGLALVEAHGKMPAAEIDEVMVGFADGRGDVLLATNIIEAGLDVPRANTMIVWRADRFGLAQLHQLRGRVGRGNRRGQVILLTKDEDGINERTMKRLRTLAAFDRLGAGFNISARDLDLRGGGDLLGDDQAGHVRLIGTDLYQHLLGAALRRARGELVEHWTPELHLGAAGALPAEWIPDEDVRLALYVRLARIADDTELDAFEDELADRFGPLPPPAELLIATARLRGLARSLSIARMDAGPAAIALVPRRGFAADCEQAGLVEKDGRWLLSERTEDTDRVARATALLEQLSA